VSDRVEGNRLDIVPSTMQSSGSSIGILTSSRGREWAIHRDGARWANESGGVLVRGRREIMCSCFTTYATDGRAITRSEYARKCLKRGLAAGASYTTHLGISNDIHRKEQPLTHANTELAFEVDPFPVCDHHCFSHHSRKSIAQSVGPIRLIQRCSNLPASITNVFANRPQ
jgi:hypothetical protein